MLGFICPGNQARYRTGCESVARRVPCILSSRSSYDSPDAGLQYGRNREMSKIMEVALVSVLWVLHAVFLASFLPGFPTIHPTPDCSVKEAKKCLELKGVCSPMPINPMVSPIPVSTTEPCLNEKPRICRKCRDAFKYEMNFFERFVHYSPFWLKYLIRVFS